MKSLNKFILFAASLMLFACDEVRQADEVEDKKVKVDSVAVQETKPPIPKPEPRKSQETKLRFSTGERVFIKSFDTLSLGNNFKEIKQIFPVARGIRPEGGMESLAAEGLTESKGKVHLLNTEADIEFNFKNDSLYSYYLTISEPDYENAEQLYDFVHSYYSKKLGNCQKQEIEEETRFSKTCTWNADGRFLVMTYNVNTGIISWGYQKTNPF